MNQEAILQAAAEAAKNMNSSPDEAVAQTVPPQPVPLSVQVTTTQQPSKFVVLVINTPVGQSVYFFDPDGAEKVANAVLDAARQARTGLEIPRIN